MQTLGEDVEGSNGAVFDLADVLHVGARHSLQSGLVGPLATSQTYSFAVLTPRSEGFASVHACMMQAWCMYAYVILQTDGVGLFFCCAQLWTADILSFSCTPTTHTSTTATLS